MGVHYSDDDYGMEHFFYVNCGLGTSAGNGDCISLQELLELGPDGRSHYYVLWNTHTHRVEVLWLSLFTY